MGHAGALPGPVNLGNPEEVTVAELARRILAMTGSASRVVYRPLPPDDPQRRCPDIARAQTVLGWTPKVPLEKGLGRTIAWFARGADPRTPAVVSAKPPRAMRSGARAGP
jgi:UDP-glucuronate decarboxylase